MLYDKNHYVSWNLLESTFRQKINIFLFYEDRNDIKNFKVTNFKYFYIYENKNYNFKKYFL